MSDEQIIADINKVEMYIILNVAANREAEMRLQESTESMICRRTEEKSCLCLRLMTEYTRRFVQV